MKLSLIVICGPTAVGKSQVALALAEELGAEIISVDSRKIYKYMDIVTAKPAKEDRSKIPHHLIDLIEPDAGYSAGQFGEEASKVIAQVRKKGKITLLVGGSGLYLRAVVDGLFSGPRASAERRERLKREAEEFGTALLHQRLKKVDPPAASKIHPNDLVRIIRALEVYEETGKCISSLQSQEKANRKFSLPAAESCRGEPSTSGSIISSPPHEPSRAKSKGSGQVHQTHSVMIGLNRDRQDLYRRIDQRVERMFSQGLVEEVKSLLKRGYHENLTSMQGLGYKEVCGYLKGT